MTFARPIADNPDTPALVAGVSYVVRPDPFAARSDHIRVIDDSGEDYLYPASLFDIREIDGSAVAEIATMFGISEGEALQAAIGDPWCRAASRWEVGE